MGGVTKLVKNIADVPGDVIDVVTGGGGGGSATPAPPPQVAEPAPTPPVEPNPGGGILGPITPQVVVYGPDGTAYPNPAAAEAAGVTNYTMTQPTFDQVGPISPIDPGFTGGATTGFPDFVTNSIVLPEEGYQYVGAGSDPANIQPIPQRSPYEAATTFSLSNQAANERFIPTPFERPEQMGGTPLSPEQAMVFARQAAQRPMQRFAGGGSVQPMQQGVGSLMGKLQGR